MFDVVLFLNEEVEKEIRADEILFVAWRVKYGTYDWEIDPLHNPDWVASQKKLEADKLPFLKTWIREIRQEFHKKP